MAKSDDKSKNIAMSENDGCRGMKMKHSEMRQFVMDCLTQNLLADQSGFDDLKSQKWAICLWGHSGIGKTSLCREFQNTPVEWKGQVWDGWDVKIIPLAQCEEMGDIHGMPTEEFLMKSPNGEELWIHREAVEAHRASGWELVLGKPSRTVCAPPDWVPRVEKPTILIMDDWNRASQRIIKGIMQLLQTFGTVSWKLPAGCSILLTGNPDAGNEYLVTSLDSAIVTRMKHATLVEDAKEWAVWADKAGLHPSGISWILAYPEMMRGSERTNPRTLSEHFRYLSFLEDPEGKDANKALAHAYSLLDDDTVNAFTVYVKRDYEKVIEPEQILDVKQCKKVASRVSKLMGEKEPRTDIIAVTMDRLYARLASHEIKATDDSLEAVHHFLSLEMLPQDVCYGFVRRIAHSNKNSWMGEWLTRKSKHHEALKIRVMDLMRDC